MRDVRDELFLVVLQGIQFVRHVVERGGEIADLIIGVNINLFFKVAGGIFVRRFRNLADRYVYHIGKQNQYHKGCQKQKPKRLISDGDKSVRVGHETAGRLVDDHITAHFVVDGDRRENT